MLARDRKLNRERQIVTMQHNEKRLPTRSCQSCHSEEGSRDASSSSAPARQHGVQMSPRLATCGKYHKLICAKNSLRSSPTGGEVHRSRSRMLRLIKWSLVHLCLPLCLATLLVAICAPPSAATAPALNLAASSKQTTAIGKLARHTTQLPTLEDNNFDYNQKHSTRTGLSLPAAPASGREIDSQQALAKFKMAANWPQATDILNTPSRLAHWRPHPNDEREIKTHFQRVASGARHRRRRSLPWATILPQRPHQTAASSSSLLTPISELRANGGSKLEPPSRPSQDRSPKQRPYFGSNLQRNVSVELGKTAQLVCKVFELGDKTVSWLRPRENEILTAGEYVYVSDPRISAANEQGSADWLLEIKDVGLNDSDSYECQVSTDPKLSLIFNLRVQAARARIKSGENNYYPVGANLEFACEILPPPTNSTNHRHRQDHPLAPPPTGSPLAKPDQIYWYHNGNLLNYANTLDEPVRRENFSIEWDRVAQLSRLKLSNIQLADSGNYTCKPTSAEPATVRLFVKKPRHGAAASRAHYSGGAFHLPNGREAQRTRQQHDDLAEASSAAISSHNLADSLSLASLAISLVAMALLHVH